MVRGVLSDVTWVRQFALAGRVYSTHPDLSRQLYGPEVEILPYPKRDEDAERERWRREAALLRGALVPRDG